MIRIQVFGFPMNRHFYIAVRYQEVFGDELRFLAAEPLLSPLVEVVDRLGPRLQVSVYDVARAEPCRSPIEILTWCVGT